MKPVCDYFELLVSSGRTPHFSKIWKFGRNEDVNGIEDLWSGGGVYDFMDLEDYLLCASDSIEDTDGGNGAHKITVYGLDKDWKARKEDVLLNGTAEVKSKTKYIRAYRAEVRTTGNVESNAGNIIIKDESIGITRAKIDPGTGQTQMAIYTVPDGYLGYIKTFYVNFTGLSPVTVINAEFRIRNYGECFRVQGPIGLQDHVSYISQSYGVPIGPYPGRTDIKLQVESNQNADVRGGFLLILEKGGKSFYQKKVSRKKVR